MTAACCKMTQKKLSLIIVFFKIISSNFLFYSLTMLINMVPNLQCGYKYSEALRAAVACLNFSKNSKSDCEKIYQLDSVYKQYYAY